MAERKVYGASLSTATMRAVACLYEKDLDFEFVQVDMRAGAHKQEPFISLNPFGQVPAYQEGDATFFESRAISKSIAYKYMDRGTQLLGMSPEESAQVGVWTEVEAHQFDPPASKLLFECLFKPMFMGTPTDEAVVAENEAKLGKVLDVYEARLGKSKYLAGPDFSLADLHHLPVIHVLLKVPRVAALFTSREHVNAWVKDITSRPAWCKVVQTYNF
ncbi:glutathione S-transferase-like isoform X1 [Nymphaea colorata]|nr:glutathione S-transferase-like isoform X1 [Nymphaea colorata]